MEVQRKPEPLFCERFMLGISTLCWTFLLYVSLSFPGNHWNEIIKNSKWIQNIRCKIDCQRFIHSTIIPPSAVAMRHVCDGWRANESRHCDDRTCKIPKTKVGKMPGKVKKPYGESDFPVVKMIVGQMPIKAIYCDPRDSQVPVYWLRLCPWHQYLVQCCDVFPFSCLSNKSTNLYVNKRRFCLLTKDVLTC